MKCYGYFELSQIIWPVAFLTILKGSLSVVSTKIQYSDSL